MNQQEREEAAQQNLKELCEKIEELKGSQRSEASSSDSDQEQTELERLNALVESQRAENASLQKLTEDLCLRDDKNKAWVS